MPDAPWDAPDDPTPMEMAAEEIRLLTAALERAKNTAWLLEYGVGEGGHPQWWNGIGCTFDANGAVRFSRKEDAELARRGIEGGYRWTATEHVWMDSPPYRQARLPEGGGAGGRRSGSGDRVHQPDA